MKLLSYCHCCIRAIVLLKWLYHIPAILWKTDRHRITVKHPALCVLMVDFRSILKTWSLHIGHLLLFNAIHRWPLRDTRYITRYLYFSYNVYKPELRSAVISVFDMILDPVTLRFDTVHWSYIRPDGFSPLPAWLEGMYAELPRVLMDNKAHISTSTFITRGKH